MRLLQTSIKNKKRLKQSFYLIFSCILLFISLIFLRGQQKYQSQAEGTPVQFKIPGLVAGIDECSSSDKIAECINRLLEERKPDSLPITITIVPRNDGINGNKYTLNFPVIIYKKNDVVITGGDNTSTKPVLEESLKINDDITITKSNLSVFNHFTFTVLDSSNVTIDNLELVTPLDNDPGLIKQKLQSQRGIGVCGLGTNSHMEGITITNLREKNYTGFFTLIGNAYDETLLQASADRANNSSFMSKIPNDKYWNTEKKIMSDLLSSPTKRFCSGFIKNVRFENNELFMRAVGFYVIPYSVHQTQNDLISYPGINITPTPGAKDWIDIHNEITDQLTGYVVRNNKFIAPDNLPILDEQGDFGLFFPASI